MSALRRKDQRRRYGAVPVGVATFHTAVVGPRSATFHTIGGNCKRNAEFKLQECIGTAAPSVAPWAAKTQS